MCNKVFHGNMRHLVRGAKRTCVARCGRTLEGTCDDLEARKCSLDDAFTATRVNLPREQDGAGFRETPYCTRTLNGTR